MHPRIQRLLLELSNIRDPSAKRATTIFLAHEFRFIMKEASEIFSHYYLRMGLKGQPASITRLYF